MRFTLLCVCVVLSSACAGVVSDLTYVTNLKQKQYIALCEPFPADDAKAKTCREEYGKLTVLRAAIEAAKEVE